jgi:hypothetical protein
MAETETVVVLIETPTIIILFEPEPVVWLHEIDVEPPPLFWEPTPSKVILGAVSSHAL